MKNIFLVFIASLFICSCSAIKAGEIRDCLKTTAEIVSLVCATESIFESAGLDVPDATQCEKAVVKAHEFLDGPEYKAIAAASKCAEENALKSKGFIECIDAVDGVALLAEQIAKRSK